MTTAAASTIRVWVPDVWDVVHLEVTPDTTIAQVKAEALARAVGKDRRADPRDFVVKYRGALVTDENQTLGALDVPDNAPMIVVPTRRRPVV
ncbi:MAG: hypothetical protein HY700_06170 [Gemmatimonadetes bacterium]|nr:hypothetical protein [Gemmatimonadota bacterium]